jgi:Fe(3+) dicitrate transport protein
VKIVFIILIFVSILSSMPDTLIYETDEINVRERGRKLGLDRLMPVEKSAIYAGKKSEIVNISDLNINLAANTSRLIFSKVSGLNVWEGDAGGLQMSIGGRGLSPSRVSNFNTRQNGYDISADALGYPESYYTPPIEAVERIEIVRGAASLQYGTQFGGFLNFKLKQAELDTPFEVITRQAGGSFGVLNNPSLEQIDLSATPTTLENNNLYGMFNTFNSVQYSKGDFAFYSYFQLKQGNGWRPFSGYRQIGGHIDALYSPNEKTDIRFEYTKMNYLAQQPGGLTDQDFATNPMIARRTRNWFSVDWNVFALVYDQKINNNLSLNIRNFAVVAERQSLGILGRADRPDTGGDRDLIFGEYANYGSESRLMYKYSFLNQPSALLTGVRLYRGFTHQMQGPADSSSAAVFSFTSFQDRPYTDFDFPGWNVSAFAENLFQITDKISITPGIRFETISTNSNGLSQTVRYGFDNSDIIPNSAQTTITSRNNTRSFLLGGIGFAYYEGPEFEFYTNFSQNYRAINFNDMQIVNQNQVIDNNLKDETGWSFDIGTRGNFNNIFDYDVNLFLLSYQDKIGEIPRIDSANFNYRVYQYRTNISDAFTYGMESFVEMSLPRLFNLETNYELNLFSNVSLIEAKYINSANPQVDGKSLELSPNMILRLGLDFAYRNLRVSTNFSYVSDQFTDATNNILAPNPIYGLIPEYYVMDLNVSYQFNWLEITAGSENLTNNKYFTRRATGYPGPGIIPSAPRNFYLNLNFRAN